MDIYKLKHLAKENRGLTVDETKSLIEYINTHCIVIWGTEDFDEIAPWMTEEERLNTLESIEENHDANNGITWDTLRDYATPEPE